MEYEYAVRFPNRKLEIRYAIRPLAAQLAEYQEAKSQDQAMADPNDSYSMLATIVGANISGGEMPATNEFPLAAVRREFGADWGGTLLVTAGAEFAPQPRYARCLIVALHKRDVADAYCFYLFDKQQDLDYLLRDRDQNGLHALRFQ